MRMPPVNSIFASGRSIWIGFFSLAKPLSTVTPKGNSLPNVVLPPSVTLPARAEGSAFASGPVTEPMMSLP